MSLVLRSDSNLLIPLPIVNVIFSYIHNDFKLLIHRDDKAKKNKRLSIELIMRCGMEDYFEKVLLSNKFKHILCNEAARRGFLSTLQWAHHHHHHHHCFYYYYPIIIIIRHAMQQLAADIWIV
jgi:hypothetical protein